MGWVGADWGGLVPHYHPNPIFLIRFDSMYAALDGFIQNMQFVTVAWVTRGSNGKWIIFLTPVSAPMVFGLPVV